VNFSKKIMDKIYFQKEEVNYAKKEKEKKVS